MSNIDDARFETCVFFVSRVFLGVLEYMCRCHFHCFSFMYSELIVFCSRLPVQTRWRCKKNQREQKEQKKTNSRCCRNG